MRALVTGGAGFIGSRLVEQLAQDGWTVRIVDSFTSYYNPDLKRANADETFEAGDVELVECDLRTARLAPLLADVDVVFHLAAQPGVRPSWDTFSDYVEHNVLATHRLLDAVLSAGTGRVIIASSSSVYGQATGSVDEDAPTRPYSPYGVTKLAGEALARAYAQNFQLDVAVLRLFTVYGPRQRPDMAIARLIDAALTGTSFPMYGDGSQVRAFTYVDDVTAAFRAAAGTTIDPGQVFNIAGGTSCPLSEVIAAVEDAAGRPIRLDRQPPSAGDVERTDAIVERARHDLGWTPAVSLAEGVGRQVDAARRRVAAARS